MRSSVQIDHVLLNIIDQTSDIPDKNSIKFDKMNFNAVMTLIMLSLRKEKHQPYNVNYI